MNKVFDSMYHKEYMDGYRLGSDPNFNQDVSVCGEAFSSGYYVGRMTYESRNGRVEDGIPPKILTDAVLEEIELCGMLGMSIDVEQYTEFQVRTLGKWYMSGMEKFEADEWISLFAFLEKLDISLL